jgi:phage terminase small subunit
MNEHKLYERYCNKELTGSDLFLSKMYCEAWEELVVCRLRTHFRGGWMQVGREEV